MDGALASPKANSRRLIAACVVGFVAVAGGIPADDALAQDASSSAAAVVSLAATGPAMFPDDGGRTEFTVTLGRIPDSINGHSISSVRFMLDLSGVTFSGTSPGSGDNYTLAVSESMIVNGTLTGFTAFTASEHTTVQYTVELPSSFSSGDPIAIATVITAEDIPFDDLPLDFEVGIAPGSLQLLDGNGTDRRGNLAVRELRTPLRFTITATTPTATLSQDRFLIRESEEEGVGFNLMLKNAPDGPAVLTYTLGYTIANPNGRITGLGSLTLRPAPQNLRNFIGRLMVEDGKFLTAGSSSNRLMTFRNQNNPRDFTNQLFTLIINNLELADGTNIPGSDIPSNGPSGVNGTLTVETLDSLRPRPTATLARVEGADSVAEGTTAIATFTLTLENAPVDNYDSRFRLEGSAKNLTATSGASDISVRVVDADGVIDIINNPNNFTLNDFYRFIISAAAVAGSGDGAQGGARGRAVVTFRFGLSAIDDGIDETLESLVFNLENVGVRFSPPTINGVQSSTLTATIVQPEEDRTIFLQDNDTAAAALNAGGTPTEADANPETGTFRLDLTEAADETAVVTYTLSGGAGRKYTAALTTGGGGQTLGGNPRSTFTIPRIHIQGTNAGDGHRDAGAYGNARAVITITPLSDADGDDETVTLTIHSITFARNPHADIAGGDITGDGVSDGAQTLVITDDDVIPTLVIVVGDATAVEPPGAGESADPGTFTLELGNLNSTQRRSVNRRFFFNFTRDSIGGGRNLRPGHGPLDEDLNIKPAVPAEDFILQYLREDGEIVPFVFGEDEEEDVYSIERPHPRSNADPETYTFRVIPAYDSDSSEGTEHLVFGYQVFFSGVRDEDHLRGFVNASATRPTVTITDASGNPPAADSTATSILNRAGPHRITAGGGTGRFTLALAGIPRDVSGTGVAYVDATIRIGTALSAPAQGERSIVADDFTVSIADAVTNGIALRINPDDLLVNSFIVRVPAGLLTLTTRAGDRAGAETVSLTITAGEVSANTPVNPRLNDVAWHDADDNELGAVADDDRTGTPGFIIYPADSQPSASLAATGSLFVADNGGTADFTVSLANIPNSIDGVAANHMRVGLNVGTSTVFNDRDRDFDFDSETDTFFLELVSVFDNYTITYGSAFGLALGISTEDRDLVDSADTVIFRIITKENIIPPGIIVIKLEGPGLFDDAPEFIGVVTETPPNLGSLISPEDEEIITSGSPLTFTVVPVPIATLSRDRAFLREGSTPATAAFTLALDDIIPDGPATVSYTLAVTGDNADAGDITAEFGGDIRAGSGPVAVNAGAGVFVMDVAGTDALGTLAITAESDGDTDNELVTLSINGIEYASGLSHTAAEILGDEVSNGTLTISVSDAAAPTGPGAITQFNFNAGTIAEAGGNTTLIITFDEAVPASETRSIPYAITGAAAFGDDYTAVVIIDAGGYVPLAGASGHIVFNAGDRSKQLRLTARNDGLPEGDETLNFSLDENGFPAGITPPDDTSTPLTIVDNDRPRLEIGDLSAEFISRSISDLISDTLTENLEFSAFQVLRFLPPYHVGDATATIHFRLDGASGVVFGTGTRNADILPPAADYAICSYGDNAGVVVEPEPGSTPIVSVQVTPSITNAAFVWEICVPKDDLIEPRERFDLVITGVTYDDAGSGTDLDINADGVAVSRNSRNQRVSLKKTYSINNLNRLTVALDGGDIIVAEGGDASATLTVSSDSTMLEPLTVTLTPLAESGDTASAADFATTVTVTIPVADYSGGKTIEVPLADLVVDDDEVEALGITGAETFTLRLGKDAAEDRIVLAEGQTETTVKIRDNDSFTVTLTKFTEDVAEPSVNGTASIMFHIAFGNISTDVTSIRAEFGFDYPATPGPGNHADPSLLPGGTREFDGSTFITYTIDSGVEFPPTHNTNIGYDIAADNDLTDDVFDFRLFRVILNNGDGTTTVPAVDVIVPGGEFVTASPNNYASQSVHVIDSQRVAPVLVSSFGRNADEKNNAAGRTAFTIRHPPPLSTADVLFTLGGTAVRGIPMEDGTIAPPEADYLLAVTNDAGDSIPIDYSGANPVFTLAFAPAESAVTATFIVTPIADADESEPSESVAFNNVEVNFSSEFFSTTRLDSIPSINIADYGDLPSATLDAAGGVVMEGDEITATVILDNVPDKATATISFHQLADATASRPTAADDPFADYHIAVVVPSTITSTVVAYPGRGDTGLADNPWSFELPPGVTTAHVVFTAASDGAKEDLETAAIVFSGVEFTDIGSGTDSDFTESRLTFSIIGPPPDVTLTPAFANAGELNNAAVVVTLPIPVFAPATVFFELSGDAKFGTLSGDAFNPGDTDYLLTVAYSHGGIITDVTGASNTGISASGGNFRLPPEARRARFQVIPVADAVAEPFEEVVITLTGVSFTGAGSGNVITTIASTIAIADYGDLPTAALEVTDATAAERGPDEGVFTLALNNAPNGVGVAEVGYTLAVTGVSAEDDDFAAAFGGDAGGRAVVGSGVFTMTVAERTASATLTITPNTDDGDAFDEDVTFTVTGITFTDIGAGTDIARDDITGDGISTGAQTITISDTAPNVQVFAANAEEGGGDGNFVFNITDALPFVARIQFNLAGTADSGDYTLSPGVGAGSLTFSGDGGEFIVAADTVQASLNLAAETDADDDDETLSLTVHTLAFDVDDDGGFADTGGDSPGAYVFNPFGRNAATATLIDNTAPPLPPRFSLSAPTRSTVSEAAVDETSMVTFTLHNLASGNGSTNNTVFLELNGRNPDSNTAFAEWGIDYRLTVTHSGVTQAPITGTRLITFFPSFELPNDVNTAKITVTPIAGDGYEAVPEIILIRVTEVHLRPPRTALHNFRNCSPGESAATVCTSVGVKQTIVVTDAEDAPAGAERAVLTFDTGSRTRIGTQSDTPGEPGNIFLNADRTHRFVRDGQNTINPSHVNDASAGRIFRLHLSNLGSGRNGQVARFRYNLILGENTSDNLLIVGSQLIINNSVRLPRGIWDDDINLRDASLDNIAAINDLTLTFPFFESGFRDDEPSSGPQSFVFEVYQVDFGTADIAGESIDVDSFTHDRGSVIPDEPYRLRVTVIDDENQTYATAIESVQVSRPEILEDEQVSRPELPEGESIVVRVTLNGRAGGAENIIPYTLTGDGIEASDIDDDNADGDGDPLSGGIAVPFYRDYGEIVITAAADGLFEGDERMIIRTTGSNSIANNAVAANNAVTVAITDSDDFSQPTQLAGFAITGGTLPLAEDGGSIVITATLDHPVPHSDPPISIPYTLTGDGVTAADFSSHTALGGVITVAPGTIKGAAVITSVDDTLAEGDETVIVALGALPNNNRGVQLTENLDDITFVISDDEADALALAIANAGPFTEAAAAVDGLDFTVTLNGKAPAGAVFPYAITGGVLGEDYRAPTVSSPPGASIDANNITIPVGETAIEINVPIIDDDVEEANETLVFTLAAGTYAGVTVPADTLHRVVIADDDRPPPPGPRATLRVTDDETTEEPGTPETPSSATYTILFTDLASDNNDVTVGYTLAGSATPGDDYEISAVGATLAANNDRNGTITLDAADISGGTGQSTINITATDDQILNETENVVLTISAVQPLSLVVVNPAPPNHDVAIIDNDAPYAVSFSSPQIDLIGMGPGFSGLGETILLRISGGPSPGLSLVNIEFAFSGAASLGDNYFLSLSNVSGDAQRLELFVPTYTYENVSRSQSPSSADVQMFADQRKAVNAVETGTIAITRVETRSNDPLLRSGTDFIGESAVEIPVVHYPTPAVSLVLHDDFSDGEIPQNHPDAQVMTLILDNVPRGADAVVGYEIRDEPANELVLGENYNILIGDDAASPRLTTVRGESTITRAVLGSASAPASRSTVPVTLQLSDFLIPTDNITVIIRNVKFTVPDGAVLDNVNASQTITVALPLPNPTSITNIAATAAPEGESVGVSVTLNRLLPNDAIICYRIFARSDSDAPIDENDMERVDQPQVCTGVDSRQTTRFTIPTLNDIRIEPDQEEGIVEITSISWAGAGANSINTFSNPANSIVPFTIVDNDAITFSLNPNTYRVRGNAGTLGVIVRAEAAPSPAGGGEVILDRDVPISLVPGNVSTSDDDFTLPERVVFRASPDTLTRTFQTANVVIRDDGDREETFTVTLMNNDRAAILGAPRSATVTIVPNARADYNDTGDVLITEDGGAAESAERILTLSHVPNNHRATARFRFTDNRTGAVVTPGSVGQASFGFSIVSGGQSLSINNMGGNFQIPAGNTGITLRFTAHDDDDSNSELITFTITDIAFDDASTGTDITDIQPLNIIVTDATALPEAILNSDDTAASEVNNDPAVATLTLLNADDAGTATVSFELFGFAFFGVRSDSGNGFDPANADYLAAVIYPDRTAENITNSTDSIDLPPDVRRIDFRFTPIADADFNEGPDSFRVAVTGVTFSNTNSEITDRLVQPPLTIADYGDRPSASLRGGTAVTEGSNVVLTFALANAPNGPDIAEVTYDLTVTGDNGDNSDITAAFGLTADGNGSAPGKGTAIVGRGNTFTMTVAERVSTATLTITANADTDLTPETVRFDVTRVTFADIGAGTDISQRRTRIVRITDAVLANPTTVTEAVLGRGGGEERDIDVILTLDRPLPQDGTVRYRILPRASSASAIARHDVGDRHNFGVGSENVHQVSANAGTRITFTVDVTDDNRIEPAMEEGTIHIISVDWGTNSIAVNTTLPFTIADNDGITLTLDANAYRVRDNAGTLNVVVNAVPTPIPSTHNGVILDRAVAATLNSRDGTATATVPNPDYTAVSETLDYDINSTTQTEIPSQTISVTIEDDTDQQEQNFSLILAASGGDRAAIIGTPEAVVTIVPNTEADYDDGSAIIINEGESMDRTLRLRHAPTGRAAAVSFELTGGAVAARDVADPALVFTAGGGATGLRIDDNGMTGGRFIIPAGTAAVPLTFEAAIDDNGDNETIAFLIDGITFAGAAAVTDIPALDTLNITITDTGASAVAEAVGGDTRISELSIRDIAVIRVRLSNLPSAVTSAAINYSLGGSATRGTDYTVALAGSSTSADTITITGADIAGDALGAPQGGATGRAEATFTFAAVRDSEMETGENIVLTLTDIELTGADDIAMGDIEGSSQTITIVDRPLTPLAVLRVGVPPMVSEGDDRNPDDNPNFEITLININTTTLDTRGTVNVNYGFDAGFSPQCAGNSGKYCAFGSISDTPDQDAVIMPLTTSPFSFAASIISDGLSGEAQFRIYILSRSDGDARDETVTLTINSITVPRSTGEPLTLNSANTNIIGTDETPTNSATITIKDDALRLRIRTFLEGALQ